jgi:hypothetical protein
VDEDQNNEEVPWYLIEAVSDDTDMESLEHPKDVAYKILNEKTSNFDDNLSLDIKTEY